MTIRLTVILFLLSSWVYTALAQTTEQLDPLRPSQPDSTQTSRQDSTQTSGVDPGQPDDPGEADQQDSVETSVVYRYRFTADGTATRGNVNRLLLQLTAAVDLAVSKQFKFSSNPSFVYGRQNALLNEREWFGDFRTTFRHEKRLYYLAFGSYERSNLRQILNRWTIAGGVGIKLVDHPKAYLSLTNVLMQERTDYTELNDINAFRNSARLFGEYTITDNLSITHTTFWQPALNQRGNVRWNGSLSVQLKMTDALSIRSTVANSYESIVVPGRVRNDLRWTMGLVYERK